MTTTKTTAVPAAEPPAAAVASDAHWTATREKLRSRSRPTTVLTICDDAGVKKALEDARYVVRRLEAETAAEVDDAGLARDLETARTDLAAAQTVFDTAAIRLTFQALRRPDFEQLKKDHPPTETDAEDNLAFNIDTLAPQLIEASSLDGITADDAAYYLTEWGEGEANSLFNAAWGVQSHARMDLGKG